MNAGLQVIFWLWWVTVASFILADAIAVPALMFVAVMMGFTLVTYSLDRLGDIVGPRLHAWMVARR